MRSFFGSLVLVRSVLCSVTRAGSRKSPLASGCCPTFVHTLVRMWTAPLSRVGGKRSQTVSVIVRKGEIRSFELFATMLACALVGLGRVRVWVP